MSVILLPSKFGGQPQYPARLKNPGFWRLVDIQGLPLLGTAAASVTRTLNGTAQLSTGLQGKRVDFVAIDGWLSYGANAALQLSTMTGIAVVEMPLDPGIAVILNTSLGGSGASGFLLRVDTTGAVTVLKHDVAGIGTTTKKVRLGGISTIAWSYNNVTGLLRVAVDGVIESFVSAQTLTHEIVGRNRYYIGNTTQAWPHKQYLFALSASDKASNNELIEWSLNPWQIFQAPHQKIAGALSKDFSGQNLTQSNFVADQTIALGGQLFIFPVTQTNTLSSDQIRRDQYLTTSGLGQTNSLTTGRIGPYGRLRAILRDMPLHTWAQVNTTNYVDCQMPLADRPGGYPNAVDHVKIVIPWSSFAFDHVRGNLILWGGGHANYSGNQVYQWHANTGAWSLSCLPSRLAEGADGFIVDGKAPQSSHTYQNNIWLRQNDMFCTFGGAALPSGGLPLEDDGAGGSRKVVPWLYDLTKTDSNKVGGGDGSGWDATRLGLNAWQHRRDNVATGNGLNQYPLDYTGHGQGAAISFSQDGKDYAVFTMGAGSGFPSWYRWEFGDVRAGEDDQIFSLGGAGTVIVSEGWQVYDSKRQLVYRNAINSNDGYTKAEIVSKKIWTDETATPIRLVNAVGGDYFQQNTNPSVPLECHYGAVYDERNDCLWLWGGLDPDTGLVYRVNIPAYDDVTGWSSTTWTVDEIDPAGSRPNGLYQTPILGKIKHVPEIDAFIILDKAGTSGDPDPGVWVFKTAQVEGDLSVASLAQGNSASTGSVTVTAEHNLSAGETAQGNAASTGTITQTQILACENVVQANAATVGAVAKDSEFTVDPVAQSNAVGTGAITQVHVLAGAGATQSNVAASTAISTGDVHNLVSSQSIQANTGSAGAITQTHVLVCPASIQDNIAAASAIVQAHILASSSVTQSNSASSGAITAGDSVLVSIVERAATFRRSKSVTVRFN